MVHEISADPQTTATIAAVRAMDEAINRHDVDAVMAVVTADVVWETTSPPDGERHEGSAAVRRAGEAFLASSKGATFETEELIARGDRAIQRWLYRWIEQDGTPGHVRGVDIFRVRDGKVCEILSYVKG
jgi:ketosteroid isomerase-like protein